MVAIHNGRFGIKYAGRPGTHEIAGHHFGGVGVIDLLFHGRMQRSLAHELVQLLPRGGICQVQIQNRHRHVRRRYPDGVTRQFAAQARQHLRHGLGRTRLGQHHIQRRTPTPALPRMIIVDQVLIIGISVHRLDVPCANAVLVICRLQDRHNSVGGARRCGENLVLGLDVTVIDSRNDILDVALAGRRQNHLRHALGFQVTRQTRFVPPDPGVIHHNAVLDAILRIVDILRGIGINHFDLVAIGNEGLALLINPDGALKDPMHRISSEKTGALEKVILGLSTAHNHSAEAQAVAAICFRNENSGH